MIPSFTNSKRMGVYLRDFKKGGLNFINWDIEEELWRFQKEIETKFAGSAVNKKFKFPLMGTREYEFEMRRQQEAANEALGQAQSEGMQRYAYHHHNPSQSLKK